MATPRKRPSSGFSEKPKEETIEKQEIEEFLEVAIEDVLQTIEKVEENPKEGILPEIVPTEDVGPRFILAAPPEKQPEMPEVQPKKPKRHPRNTPRFARTAK